MKAWAALEPGQIECVDIPVPEPADYEALIKIEACVICNSTDWMVVRNHFGAAGFPVLFGHESFGKVVKTGKHVRNLKIGDRVTSPNAIPRGFDGKYYSAWGGFAQYGIAGDYHALKEDMGNGIDADKTLARYAANLVIPADFPLDRAGLTIALSETASCVMQLGTVRDRDIVVLGTGIAGLSLVMFSKLNGAGQVLCVGRRADRLRRAEALGADQAYLSGDEGMTADILARMSAGGGKRGADIVFEATGKYNVLQKGLPYLAEEGTLAIYGVPEQPYIIDTYASPKRFSIQTVAPDEAMAMDYACSLLRQEDFPADLFMTHRWGFDDLPQAMNEVRSGEVVKGIVIMP